jgi:excisionase family DNA binding protein
MCTQQLNFKNYSLSNLMTVKELQEYLKIGKNTAYRLINNNEVPTVKIGNRTYVVVDKLQKYINSHTIL